MNTDKRPPWAEDEKTVCNCGIADHYAAVDHAADCPVFARGDLPAETVEEMRASLDQRGEKMRSLMARVERMREAQREEAERMLRAEHAELDEKSRALFGEIQTVSVTSFGLYRAEFARRSKAVE